MASRRSCSPSRPNAFCLRESARSDGAFRRPPSPNGPWHTVVGVTADIRNGRACHGCARARDLPACTAGRMGRPPMAGLPPGPRWPSRAAHDGTSRRCGGLPPADRRRPRSEVARHHRDGRPAGREPHAQAALHRVAADGIRRARAAAGGRRAVQRRVLFGDCNGAATSASASRSAPRRATWRGRSWAKRGAGLVGGALLGCCARLDGYARAAVAALSGRGAGSVVVDRAPLLCARAASSSIAVFRPAFDAAHVDPGDSAEPRSILTMVPQAAI